MTTPQKKRANAQKKADALFSARIREIGRCWADTFRFECAGPLQCCHIVSRRYHAVRWRDDNAVAMCQGHHLWFTHHPLEWEDYVKYRGIDYALLRMRALSDPPERAADALERLKA